MFFCSTIKKSPPATTALKICRLTRLDQHDNDRLQGNRKDTVVHTVSDSRCSPTIPVVDDRKEGSSILSPGATIIIRGITTTTRTSQKGRSTLPPLGSLLLVDQLTAYSRWNRCTGHDFLYYRPSSFLLKSFNERQIARSHDLH
jgi:hypothetical protein